ncbi:hypothetical protein [Arcticibacter sp. MXS-1]|uniref:hypothetical protein n=1 Tax=Arcticibacter sp. MXS-1 TaxID=3341726 RepID=UPI0035A9067B
MVKLNGFFRLVAGVTLLAFCSMQGLLAMHHHEVPDNRITAKHGITGTAVEKADVKCQICDFITGHQQKHAHFCHQPELPLKTSLPHQPGADRPIGLGLKAVLSWTNKGPPSC